MTMRRVSTRGSNRTIVQSQDLTPKDNRRRPTKLTRLTSVVLMTEVGRGPCSQRRPTVSAQSAATSGNSISGRASHQLPSLELVGGTDVSPFVSVLDREGPH